MVPANGRYDLPVHGALPPRVTRLEIAQLILAILKREKLPRVYGFINGGRGAEDPDLHSVLQAWRKAEQPLGNHTWMHLDLNQENPQEFGAELKNEVAAKPQRQVGLALVAVALLA